MSWASVDLYDDFEDSVSTCGLQFRSLGAKERFCGPVRTVSCFEDNSLVRSLLETPGEGCVLVVDGQGSMGCALMGDMIAAMAARNGWAGVLINGCVRDALELKQIDLGIFALGTNPAKSRKQNAGRVDEPVIIGNGLIAPGMWIYCDIDGVLISPKKIT